MTPVDMVGAIREALGEEMERDPTVVLLGEDVGVKGGVFKASEGLLDRFGPLRVLDTPVAEIGIAGVAIGAAMMGLRPVAEFQFADYMHPAYDQIVNQAATMRWRSLGEWSVPVVFRAPFGAVNGGGVYHSQSPEAAYCHVPGLKVVAPATPSDAKGLLKAAIRDDDPVVFFEHKRNYRTVREDVGDDVIPLGVARLDRAGRDVSVVTYGGGVHLARDAADARRGRWRRRRDPRSPYAASARPHRHRPDRRPDRTPPRPARSQPDHGIRGRDRGVRRRGALLRTRRPDPAGGRRRLPPDLQPG